MLRRTAPLALALLAACASHQKAGDKAGAVGDWKTAEREYAQALHDEPGSAELAAKHAAARAQALSAAVGHARACAAASDWECAFAEADYASGLDPADAQLALLRRDAGRSLGAARVRRAEDAVARNDPAAGLTSLAQARAVTDDARVLADAQRLQPGLVRAAVGAAERLRSAGQYSQAIGLLALAADADGSVRPRLEAMRAEHERALDAEYEQAAQAGDAALAQGRYADAQGAYEAALRARSGGRAAPLARYAAQMQSGQAAAQSRQWDRAARAYEAAAKTGVADRGQAAMELERVRVRAYAVRLRSLLIRPARPDGRPWAGARTAAFDAAMSGGRSGRPRVLPGEGSPARLAADAARALPAENLPLLVVHVDAPGGARLATSPRRAVSTPLDATLVLAANHYDDRALTISVTHDAGGHPQELGRVAIPVGELIARRSVALADGSILRLEVEASPSDAAAGSASGFSAGTPVTSAAPPRR